MAINISESLLEAMDIVIDNKINQLKYDKTIKAEIVKLINATTGEYKVRYTGGTFPAYANDLSKNYQPGQNVFIKVPEGDFSNRKTIEGTVNGEHLGANSVYGVSNIEVVSQNLLQYNKSEEPYGLVAAGRKDQPSSDYISISANDGFTSDAFMQYAQQYEYMQIKADFRTELYDAHTKGNYGIVLTCKSSDEEEKEDISYVLDINSFNGSPYAYSTWAPQSVIIKVQKGSLTNITGIKFFQDGFDKWDMEPFVDEKGHLQYKEVKDTPNLFVKNIELNFIQYQDYSNDPLYLAISTPQGVIINKNNREITLTGKLYSYGKKVESKVQEDAFVWYKRNASIMTNSESYDKNVGPGWERLAASKDLVLTADQVPARNQYKLVANYDTYTKREAEIEIINVDVSFCYLEQITESEEEGPKLKVNISKVPDNISYQWYANYPGNRYESLESETGNTLKLKDYMQYSSVTFYCLIMEKDQPWTTLSYTLVNTNEEQDFIVEWQGDDSFRYDANGDIDLAEYEKDRTLAALVKWQEGKMTNYTLTYYIQTGIDKWQKITTENPLTPANSMVTNIQVDNSKILHYNINKKFDNNKQMNQIKLEVKLNNTQTVYTYYKPIIFVKDGDQGTNGTTYIISVRPKNDKYSPLKHYGNWADNWVTYKCIVYRDGEEVNENITYKWTGYNLAFKQQNKNECSFVGSGFPIDMRYLECEVTITDNSVSEGSSYHKVTLYAIVPIDTVIENLDISHNIPNYIKYSADGTSPKYDRTEIEVKQDEESLTSDLKTQNDKLIALINENKAIKPANKFYGYTWKRNQSTKKDEIENPSVLYIENKLYHPIIMYLDTYGNEAINGWDGLKLDIDNEGQYIFSPKIGVGKKDNQNRFTGLVMGQATVHSNLWGLYGFNEGKNTFGLDVNGVAYFGVAENQIKINPNGVSFQIGPDKNPVFKVDNTGKMTATSGTIGGWIISNTEIRDKNRQLILDSETGKLTAHGAEIYGDLYSEHGNIGGWIIDDNQLYSSDRNNSIVLTGGTQPSIQIGDTKIVSYTNNTMHIQGPLMASSFTVHTADTNLGTIGYVPGNDGQQNTQGVGIKVDDSLKRYSIILESNVNGRFSADNVLWLEGGAKIVLDSPTINCGPDGSIEWVRAGKPLAYFA